MSGGAFVIFFLVLNLFWFYKIVSHAIALFFRREPTGKYSAVVSSLPANNLVESLELQHDGDFLEDDLDHYEMA
jgi:hypothetical protein